MPDTNRATFKSQCTTLAIALWIASIVTMLFFGKEPKWVSDALLICGFWPLLYFLRPSWPWLVFGTSCLALAVEISACSIMLPTTLPANMLPIRQHIIEHHQIDPWLLLGLASIFYGTIRAMKNLVLWLKEKF